MRIERTHDMRLVAGILSHPAIFPHIHEDGVTEPDPIDHEGFHWLLVDDGEPAGVFLAHARSAHCYEIHTCLLPRIWGSGAKAAASAVLDHLFNVIGCKKVVTNVPAPNRAALRFAKASGLQVEGINRASYMLNGTLHDQIMLGITLEEYKTCQQ